MTNILKRIEILEREIGGNCVVPEKERLIVIPYPVDQKNVFEKLIQENIENLKRKYGPNIDKNGLLIIGIEEY